MPEPLTECLPSSYCSSMNRSQSVAFHQSKSLWSHTWVNLESISQLKSSRLLCNIRDGMSPAVATSSQPGKPILQQPWRHRVFWHLCSHSCERSGIGDKVQSYVPWSPGLLWPVASQFGSLVVSCLSPPTLQQAAGVFVEYALVMTWYVDSQELYRYPAAFRRVSFQVEASFLVFYTSWVVLMVVPLCWSSLGHQHM